MKKILVIQTAFIGDVILATAVVEKLKEFYPESAIDFMVRNGHEGLLTNNPNIRQTLIWQKSTGKYKNLLKIVKTVRQNKYDIVINLQRFMATGLITVLSGAKYTAGFAKNPLSIFFKHRANHTIGNGTHEIYRNQELIKSITNTTPAKPRLYPSETDFEKVKAFKQNKYVCISPASVWFTKQFPATKWAELIDYIGNDYYYYLLGAKNDYPLCESIKNKCSYKDNVKILAGEINLLQSAALMRDAAMNYMNDSAPLHLASAMNAQATVVFCSTSPAFGFGPVSDSARIITPKADLKCWPCGIHGHKECPLKHFKCALDTCINDKFLF